MSSLLAEPPAGLIPADGVQVPRILLAPDGGDPEQGRDACVWLAGNGLVLDPWQRLCLEYSLAERADGQWAAFEVGLTVARQNGKGSVLAARELAGLFLLGEELIIHTAHQWKTAHEAFLRIRQIIQASPELMGRVKGFPCSPGSDAVLLKDGRRLQFIARSRSSGRGFSADLVILDEAYDLTSDQMAALLPTLSAMPNPQVWYASSAPMEQSEVLHRVRERALAGGSSRLCYLEWSAPQGCDPADRGAWAQANPALGIRIPAEFIEAEFESLPPHEFGRERLGWPDKPVGAGVFSSELWDGLLDRASTVESEPFYGLAVSEDRKWACVAVAGANGEGLTHVEYGIYQAGTAWVADWLAELSSRRRVRVAVRPNSEAGSLIVELENKKVDVARVSMQEYAQFCGGLFDSVTDKRDLRHPGQPALNVAVSAARQRRTGDAFVWEQRSATDICPLEAVTLAFGQSRRKRRPAKFMSFS